MGHLVCTLEFQGAEAKSLVSTTLNYLFDWLIFLEWFRQFLTFCGFVPNSSNVKQGRSLLLRRVSKINKN